MLSERSLQNVLQMSVCKNIYQPHWVSCGARVITHDRHLSVRTGRSPVSSTDSRRHSGGHDKWTGPLCVV
jgi:hypothetical protein